MNYERIEAAAKGAFPELWPDDLKDLGMDARAALTYQRQSAIDRMVAGLAAYEEVPDDTEGALNPDSVNTPPIEDVELPDEESDEGRFLGSITMSLPENAAMVTQTLTVLSFIDEDGRTAYGVQFTGEGQRTSWLGMCVLAQDYILKQTGKED